MNKHALRQIVLCCLAAAAMGARADGCIPEVDVAPVPPGHSPEEVCTLSCDFGFKTDSSGTTYCECAQDICIMVLPAPQRDPRTGECVQFPTVCDIPSWFEPCDDDPCYGAGRDAIGLCVGPDDGPVDDSCCLPDDPPTDECWASEDCLPGSACVVDNPACASIDCQPRRFCAPLSCRWDSDCPSGSSCAGSSVCPPDAVCFWAGEPGQCLPAAGHACGSLSCPADQFCSITYPGVAGSEPVYACSDAWPVSSCDAFPPHSCACFPPEDPMVISSCACGDADGFITISCWMP